MQMKLNNKNRKIAHQALIQAYHRYKSNKELCFKIFLQGLNSPDSFIRRATVALIYLNPWQEKDKIHLLEKAAIIEIKKTKEPQSENQKFNLQQNLFYLYRLGSPAIPALKRLFNKLTTQKNKQSIINYIKNIK